MHESDNDQIRESWAMLEPLTYSVTTVFYAKLFELDPSLRTLFPYDLFEQKQAFGKTIGAVVRTLDELDRLTPLLRHLGERHAVYGVRPRDYDTVAEALLWTLEQGLDDAFTPQVEGAWTKLYDIMATTMKEGAAQAAQAV